MVFRKTGDAPVQIILCSCGGEIDPQTKKCKKCEKKWKGIKKKAGTD